MAQYQIHVQTRHHGNYISDLIEVEDIDAEIAIRKDLNANLGKGVLYLEKDASTFYFQGKVLKTALVYLKQIS